MLRVLLILLILGVLNKTLCIVSSQPIQLYVVPFPSLFGDHGNGSRQYPYSSLQQALDHIKSNDDQNLTSNYRTTTINLYPTYHFVSTIHISEIHNHIRLTTMNDSDVNFYKDFADFEPMHRRLSTAVISGGIPITNWTAIGNNTYKAVLQSQIFVNQLFVNNQRIVRSRVPTNYSEYLYYAAPLNDSVLAHYGFQYRPGQFNYTSLVDAMVVIYHSWSTSHHYIDRLIPENNTIFFSNPTDYTIGHFVFQGQQRFHIENLCEVLSPNSFCFINETKTIYLMTDGSYNPNQTNIIAPIYEFVLIIASNNVTNPVEDIIIDNLAIQHSAWNINRTEMADGLWQSFLTTDALYIANATSIIISNVEISHTGSYAAYIKEGTNDIHIINSFVNDTGAGGIRIGQEQSPVINPTNSINIISNEISYGGNVFAGGVALIVFRSNNVHVVDNLIHHHRYTGISLGRQFAYGQSYISNVLVQGNYIYNIGQHILCDQGGIYSLGVQPGTVITGNVVKNVYSYSVFMWGIYLDEGSSQILVTNNIVYNTGWASVFQHYGANNTIINNVFARASLIPLPSPGSGVPDPDGDLQVGKAENHTSWTFINNIIYDTYQGSNHSVYTTYPDQIPTTIFNKNVYYNPYGTALLFGVDNTSFTQWQATGQDNDSVIADPLFIGDVNQCDFFTIRADSPAAKLGFANITKPSRWTPGCQTDDSIGYPQFYHW